MNKTNINKILIANRGEIATRVIRTCKELGIYTVAVFSDVDSNAPHVKQADEAIALNGLTSLETYLDQDKIINAAKITGADAIHPGYGFLAENATFAERCAREGIIFIGPKPQVIHDLGDKKRAKAIMEKHGVPVVPGYDGAKQDETSLAKEARNVGFPLLLKASAGGGGKGMRIVREEKDLKKEIAAAKSEAKAAFGDDTLLIEKYFEGARHIEVQILGDEHGNAIHLFERECSIQRRYQKIIEESPSPALIPEQREAITASAVLAAKAVNYSNAGTVEFIFSDNGEYYFLEVNTRLQVEHPVTESVTGLDLVALQIRVASGEPLPLKQEDISMNGHAIECRLYAEDPYNNYVPVTGKIHAIVPDNSPGLRYDMGVESGSEISAFYDPMIAKVIAYGNSRTESVRKLNKALKGTLFAGPKNNKAFLCDILKEPDFLAGKFNTKYLDDHSELTTEPVLQQADLASFLFAATVKQWLRNQQNKALLQNIPQGWRNVPYQDQQITFSAGNETYTVYYSYKAGKFSMRIGDANFTISHFEDDGHNLSLEVNGYLQKFKIYSSGNAYFINRGTIGDLTLQLVDRFPELESEAAAGSYVAPMPGQVVRVCVKPGDTVKAGDALLVINSMKMENTIEAYEEGIVEEIYVEAEGFVEADSLLLKMKTEEA